MRERCTPEMRKACAADLKQNLDSVCAQCEAREYEPSPWCKHILFLYMLRSGGYPFQANELNIDEWLAIGEVKQFVVSGTA